MNLALRSPTLHRATAGLLALSAAAAHPAAGTPRPLPIAAPPVAGHYDARMCVTVGSTPQQCGPVIVDVGQAGQLLVRFSDIAYRLEVYGEQLGVTLFHGPMQVDGYFAQYQWSGSQLQFIDTEKNTRHELRLGPRRFDAP
jgi:hypothetical protein